MNSAVRLATLLALAKELGEKRPTAPSFEIWSSALGEESDTCNFLRAISDVDKVIDEVLFQVSLIDKQLLDSVGPRINALHEVLTLDYLSKSWRSTIRYLGDDFDLALRVCVNTLDSRINERDLTSEQITFIRSKLEDLRQECTDLLPPGLFLYLAQSIDALESALDRYWLLGPEYLARTADSVVATVGREVARRPHAPAHHVGLVKRLGAIAGALATTITLSVVVQLDPITIQMLPWGDRPNAPIVECVMQSPVNSSPSMLAHGQTPPIESPQSSQL